MTNDGFVTVLDRIRLLLVTLERETRDFQLRFLCGDDSGIDVFISRRDELLALMHKQAADFSALLTAATSGQRLSWQGPLAEFYRDREEVTQKILAIDGALIVAAKDARCRMAQEIATITEGKNALSGYARPAGTADTGFECLV